MTRGAADLAVVGARVRTLDPALPAAEAVAMRAGTIVAVGDEAAVREHCDARTEIVDLAGQTLTPGLVDAHLHPVWGAEFAVGADLTRCATLADLHDALAAERRRVGPGGWLRGWGLSYEPFGGEPPHARALDPVTGDTPALLLFADLHTALANRAALQWAGVTGGERFADASAVVVADDEPTGELRESSAYRLVLDAMPAASDGELRAAVVGVLRRLNELGLTGAHAMDGTPETLDLLRAIEEEGMLSARLVVPLWQRPGDDPEQQEAQLALRAASGRRWRGGVAKFFIDGVVESGTAWLDAPDAEGGGTEPYWPDPRRYSDAVRRFAGAGFQCVTHAVGDRAVRAALDAYRDAGPAAGGAPHRIEHLELMAPRDLDRLAAAGVVASMQPLHMQWRDPDGDDPFARRLGPDRASTAFRTQDVLRAGAPLALGSDWPVASCDPRIGMAWARLRRAPGRRDVAPFEPQQRLDGLQALAGYTTGAAVAVGEGGCAGRIAPGARADLTGWAEDPVTCDPDTLPDLPIVLTVVDGEVVFRAP